MMNSKNTKRATAVIEKILQLSDEEYLQNRIDRPIEKVLSNFEYEANAQITHHHFMNTITHFVGQIYLYGFGNKQHLSQTQAGAEALFIIEKAFGSADVPGYDVAIVEAFTDFGSILTGIARFFISWTRKKHIRWVYTTCLDPLDWQIKCLIAEILIKMWEPFLPPTILSCSPSQLTNVLPQLFDAVQSSESFIQKTMGAGLETEDQLK